MDEGTSCGKGDTFARADRNVTSLRGCGNIPAAEEEFLTVCDGDGDGDDSTGILFSMIRMQDDVTYPILRVLLMLMLIEDLFIW